MTGTPAGPEVVAVRAWWVRFPLVRPHVAAHGSTSRREVVVVSVTDAVGTVGWGECDALDSPGYSAEHTAGAWEAITTLALPDLLAGGTGMLDGRPMASAAVATAVLDARLRSSATSLAAHLGADRARVPSRAVCGLTASLDDLLVDVASRVEAGHRHVKLKVRPGWDTEPVAAVRASWPDLGLAVDANASYADVVAAVDGLVGMGAHGVDYVEQPLPADQLAGNAEITARTGLAVALDESVGGLEDLVSAHRVGALSLLNVKPARVGGPEQAAALARAAVDMGLAAFCGGMVEAGVGRAAALAVAALAECSGPTDLGPTSRYTAADITRPFELDPSGRLPVPDGPGIGVDVDEDRLESLAVRRWSAPR